MFESKPAPFASDTRARADRSEETIAVPLSFADSIQWPGAPPGCRVSQRKVPT